jgi:Mn2+/Fe2+ NRAMP family transporter
MVCGQGLAGVLRERYPRAVLYGAVVLLFGANTVNVGADLGAVADAMHLLTGAPALFFIAPVALAILALQIFGSYRLIANIFKWLTLALVAYVIDALIVHPDLRETFIATLVPTLRFDPQYLTTILAILGTTISPYLFFWQSSEEVEEEVDMGRTTRSARRGASPAEVRYSTIDVTVGMAFSNVVMYFIILATALTLYKAGETNVRTATDAAEALRPFAGDFAGALFAAGMIGAGMLGIPVLTGSAAYAIAEAFGWRYGLQRRWSQAKPFYAVIVVATILGATMNLVGINSIDALFYAALLNGIIAPPILVLVMLAARNPKVMGRQTIGPLLTFLGWLATAVMFLALAGLAFTTSFAGG